MEREHYNMFVALSKAELGRGITAERFVRQYARSSYAQVKDVALTERQVLYLLWLHHRYRRQLEHTCTDACGTLEQRLSEAERKERVRQGVEYAAPQDKERARLEKWNLTVNDWLRGGA